MVFSKTHDEVITAHGFSSKEINVWQVKGLNKIASLRGHQNRVLYLSMNPEGNVIVSGAGDETLRFWDMGYGNIKKEK